MTISATGRNRPGRGRGSSAGKGYTLLEICIVLFILALLIGAAVPHLTSWLSEERLREPARRLELLARTARLSAMERQQPCEVVIRPDSLSLDAPLESTQTDRPVSEPSYPVADSVTLLTKAWGESDFSNRPEVRWRFQPSGLCEPLSVEFLQSGSQIVLRFDPLTATVAEEKYEFR